MTLFKAVKKPVIRQTSQTEEGSSRRPWYAPKPAPCTVDCPIGCDVRGMLSTMAEAAAEGRSTDAALALAWLRITARNPFPAMCGRICSHPCESNCHRQLKEGAVAVQLVERFVGDQAIAHGLGFTRARELPDAVAATSAGPAGLTAAYHLARRGYRVKVFEKSERAGGAMRSGVPHEILDAEIGRILALGVELVCGCGDAAAAARAACETIVDTAPLEGNDASAVAPSIAAGMRAAATIGPGGAAPPLKDPVPRERMRPECYAGRARIDEDCEPAVDSVFAEAGRCMTCGMCMACGNCWSYCTKGGFEKIPQSRRFRLNLERCNGCAKCRDGCPSGYIDMV
jgi:Pyruvate/2-oxoacid:ferredoxin oxidoreductase delta subunit